MIFIVDYFCKKGFLKIKQKNNLWTILLMVSDHRIPLPGVPIDSMDPSGCTSLHTASANQNTATVLKLLKLGVDPNVKVINNHY
jgi:hypothetical protein